MLMKTAQRAAYLGGYAWASVVLNPRWLATKRVGRAMHASWNEGFHAHAEKIRADAEVAVRRLEALKEAS